LSNSNTYTIVGVMSGTSLDGLDLALCEFENSGISYKFKILKSETVAYSDTQREKLKNASLLAAENFSRLDFLFGKFIGSEVKKFINDVAVKPDAVASHGHTIFHQPKNGFSVQAGCGATIAAECGLTTVCDFRSLDVALKGQGAPLVPIGDKFLFNQFQSCLNIGGIANISFDNKENKRVAFDICPANMALNHFAGIAGLDYDKDGDLARRGKCDTELLEILNNLSFYHKTGAKSLGREWFEQAFLSIVENYGLNLNDTLNTLTQHVAEQVAKVLNKESLRSVLITGGGTYNIFLIEELKSRFKGEIHIPDDQTVNFKEALIFAFLGYLRINSKINTLSSVTGATRDSIGGAVYLGG
jgi:anhydro-N-acetylmuramic acid kinase